MSEILNNPAIIAAQVAEAKINAAKSNQASVAKYIAAEVQKCNLEESESMSGELDCSPDSISPESVAEAAIEALGDFKNSHNPKCPGVTDGVTAGTPFSGTDACEATGLGYTTLITSTEDADFLVISTEVDKDGNTLSNEVEIE